MAGCWAMLATYSSLYFPLAIFLVRHITRSTGVPLLLSFPTVWIGLEFLRSFVMTGFPWYFLAHTQHDILPLIQIADIGGAFAVSFLVAAVNVVIFEGLCRFRSEHAAQASVPHPRTHSFFIQFTSVLLVLAATLAYGFWNLSEDTCEPGPRIALLQGNIDQRLRIAAHRSAEAKAKVQAVYFDLCLQASTLHPPPALIVWPETSYPSPWLTVAPHVEPAKQPAQVQKEQAMHQDFVRMIGPLTKTNVLLGLNTEMIGDNQKIFRFNSALLIDATNKPQGRYDKIHRVPFGEYIPLRDWLPFMNVFSPYDFDYSIGQGDGLTRFMVGEHRFGVLICFEDSDPFMARDYGISTNDGPPVDFLVNISNDGWFDGSSEHEEHLAISRFRAIETPPHPGSRREHGHQRRDRQQRPSARAGEATTTLAGQIRNLEHRE